MPRQVYVRSPKANNKPLMLPYQTSLFDVRLALLSVSDTSVINGLRAFNLPAGLIATAPTYFAAQPIAIRVALASVADVSDTLERLSGGGNSTIAGRLAGVFRNIGRNFIVDNLVETMRAAGYTINEVDPFKGLPYIALNVDERSPYVNPVSERRRVYCPTKNKAGTLTMMECLNKKERGGFDKYQTAGNPNCMKYSNQKCYPEEKIPVPPLALQSVKK